jgi:N-methylhydantoinase B
MVDPITVEVVGNALMACAEEVAASLIRAAFSSNIKERADCSVAIFDGSGRLIVQAEHIPIHLGSMLGIVDHITRRYAPEEIHPGDVFLANDPYTGGGTHLPDITVARPVFYGGRPVAYVANIAHHSDIGGRVPGSNSGDTRHIFEEGLRVPPVKIMNEGVMDQDVLDIILLNSRLPRERSGDLKAQICAAATGEERILRLYDRYGDCGMRACLDSMLAYAERRIRARISAVPDGIYHFIDYMDDDGVLPDPVPIEVTITVAGDTITLDFSGSGREAQGALNLVETALRATVYYAVKAILDPSCPSNSGFQRAIVVKAPPHTIVNAFPPAPVSARTETGQRVADAIFGAMAQATPQSVVAGCNGTLNGINISGVDPRSGEFYVYPETIGGGMGARPHKDGLDGVHVHVTNSSNLPIEALETEYPLRVERYELVRDSCGSGRHRGGMGIRRDITALDHAAEVSTHADRQKFSPWGLFGGKSGTPGRLAVNLGRRDERALPSGKTSGVILRPGDTLSVITPGAGGYGPAEARAREAVADDLRNDVISPAKALADYGSPGFAANGLETKEG